MNRHAQSSRSKAITSPEDRLRQAGSRCLIEVCSSSRQQCGAQERTFNVMACVACNEEEREEELMEEGEVVVKSRECPDG